MTMLDGKRLEAAVNAEVDALLTALWKISRDPWLNRDAANRVAVLASGIGEALVRYEKLADDCETDNGPTPADERGGVRHDIA
jgi:hypothetical protein